MSLLQSGELRFTWSAAKARSNARKHGVTFAEAVTVFGDPSVLIEGQDHAAEARLLAIGYSSRSRLVFVVFAEVRHEEIRIISARRAESRERRAYEDS